MNHTPPSADRSRDDQLSEATRARGAEGRGPVTATRVRRTNSTAHRGIKRSGPVFDVLRLFSMFVFMLVTLGCARVSSAAEQFVASAEVPFFVDAPLADESASPIPWVIVLHTLQWWDGAAQPAIECDSTEAVVDGDGDPHVDGDGDPHVGATYGAPLLIGTVWLAAQEGVAARSTPEDDPSRFAISARLPRGPPI